VIAFAAGMKIEQPEVVMLKHTDPSETASLPVPVSQTQQQLQPLSIVNPLMPWFNLMPFIRFEYLSVEIRVGDGAAHLHGERKSLRNGELFEERVDATLPAELYFEAAERLQQQMQSMAQALMMPWAAMMLPFFRNN